MRKIACLIMAAALVLSLAGCRRSDEAPDQTEPEPTPETTVYVQEVIPEPELEPTPEPEPVELLSPSQITMETSVNRTLGVSYVFPSNWEPVYGRHTLCYVEPTTVGTEAARMAISYKAASSKPGDTEMQNQMNSVLAKLEERCESLTAGEFKFGVGMLGTKGYRQTYTATVNGQEVSGYLIMAYNAGSIYLLHMSAPTDRYEALSDIWYNIRMGVLPLS